MFLIRRRRLTIGLCVCLSAGPVARDAHAQDDFPSRPVVIVVPFPPGGSGDVQARIIARELSRRLGQSVVVENRAGASTAIGAGHVAQARPDGYTLLLSSASTFTLSPAVNKALPYDPIESFQPVGMISRVSLVLLAGAGVAAGTLKELEQIAKAQPGRLAYASFGTGTSSHFAGAIAFNAMGIELLHVPYRGSAAAMTDLIGGRVPLLFDTVTSAVPQIRAGTVRALAITSAQRFALLPDVPTFAECGYPSVDFDSWGMLVGPRGLPPAVLAKLEDALRQTMDDKWVRSSLAENGVEASFAASAESAAYLEAELPLMRAVAARSKIQPE